MQRRDLGGSGLSVAAIGLGCMGMSEFYGPSDPAESRRTLDRALEIGIDFLDTADMYGRGANETLLGDWLKGRRDKVVLATKFGLQRSDDPDARPVDTSSAYVRQACDASLRRLGTDVIDLFYMHRRNKDVPIEETVGAMADLVKDGKVRAIGLCEVSIETLRRAHSTHPIAAVQSELSLWSRDQEREILPACQAEGIAFVAYSPLGRGALTTTSIDPKALAEDDFRRSIPRFSPENMAANAQLIVGLREMAEAKGTTPAQLALAWLLKKRGVIPIPGTRRVERLEENAAAAEIQIKEEDAVSLDALFDPSAVKGDRTTAVGQGLLGL